MTTKPTFRAIATLTVLTAMSSPAQGQEIQRFDPIYEHNSGGDHHLRGDAIWVVFARCAAFHRNVELFIQNYRDDMDTDRARAIPRHLATFTPIPEQEARIRQANADREQRLTQKGIAIMGQDRPGQAVEAEFRMQIDREFADLVAFPRMPTATTEIYDHRCRAFENAVDQNALIAGRRRVRGAGIPVSGPLTHEMIARIRARDGG